MALVAGFASRGMGHAKPQDRLLGQDRLRGGSGRLGPGSPPVTLRRLLAFPLDEQVALL